MPIQHVVIEEFKDTSRPDSYWRVNWFGGIERDPEVATEYKLQVVLTKVKDDTNGAWHTEEAVEQDTLRMVPIGVGQLPLLRMGSIWRDGTLEILRSGVEKVFDLDIPPGLPNYYIATDKVGPSGLIPFRDHRLMGFGKNTKCIVLPHNGDQAGIIIPAIELIRFYYANSTRLSKAIFDGDFIHSPSSIFDPDYTGLDGELAVVCRRQDVSDDDCWTIARILNSPEAFGSVRRVSDSMIRDFTNTRSAHPECAFPFSGKTRIKALCKRIGSTPTRWLVLSLISCSAAFPYAELQVIADNDNTKAPPETDIPDDAKTPIQRPNGTDDNRAAPLKLQSEEEPDKATLPKRLELSGDTFLALSGKKIKKLEKEFCNYKSGQLRPIVSPESDKSGTANGNHGEHDIGRAELQRVRSESLPPSYDLFVSLIDELNSRKEVSARLLPLVDGAGLIKAMRTTAAGKRQWAYIDHQKRQLRHFMFAEIRVSDNYYYLVEIERRPPPASDSYCSEILFDARERTLSLHQINQVANILSRQSGRISDLAPLSLLGIHKRVRGLKHMKPTLLDCADKILHGIATAKSC